MEMPKAFRSYADIVPEKVNTVSNVAQITGGNKSGSAPMKREPGGRTVRRWLM